MVKLILIGLAIVVLIIIAQPAYSITYNFEYIDYPEATDGTVIRGLNNSGHLVGSYYDSDGTHGFFYDGNNYIKIDYPNADFTYVRAINDHGIIVGVYSIGGATFSFKYNDGIWSSISYPGQGVTILEDINNSDIILGYYSISMGPDVSFLMENGLFTTIEHPSSTEVFSYGMNDYNHIVGYYIGYHGFYYDGNSFADIDYPPVLQNDPLVNTQPRDINKDGVIVGIAFWGADGNSGFILKDGSFFNFVNLEGQELYPYSINDNGQIAGYCLNQSNGFIATPVNDDFSDTCENAVPINLGSQIEAKIDVPGDEDNFLLNIPTDGTLTIYSTSVIDTYVTIKDKDCNILIENDNAGGDNNFRVVQHLSQGTYRVAVRCANSLDGMGDYILNVSFESDNLLSTLWQQQPPYTVYFDINNDDLFKPDLEKKTGDEYVVGCTAIAIGQLINYYFTKKGYENDWLDVILQDRVVYPRFFNLQEELQSKCEVNGCHYEDGYPTQNSYINSIPPNYVIETNSPLEGGLLREFLWNVAIGLDAKFTMNDGTGILPYDDEYHDWVSDTRDKIQSLLVDRFRFNPNLSHTTQLQRLDAEKDYIIDRINKGHPVLMSMYGKKTSDNSDAGHTVLIDAYKVDQNGVLFVKINFGWGNLSGENDKWNPGTGSFTDGADFVEWNSFYIYSDTTPYLEQTSGGGSTSDGDDGGGGGCFIATAAFGSPMQPYVKILRKFRDRYLLESSVGKALVNLYYKYSPPMAGFITNHGNLRAMVRIFLLPVVGMSWVALEIGPVSTIALLLFFCSGIIALLWCRRKYKGYFIDNNQY